MWCLQQLQFSADLSNLAYEQYNIYLRSFCVCVGSIRYSCFACLSSWYKSKQPLEKAFWSMTCLIIVVVWWDVFFLNWIILVFVFWIPSDQYTRSYKYRMKAMDKMTELGQKRKNLDASMLIISLYPNHKNLIVKVWINTRALANSFLRKP